MPNTKVYCKPCPVCGTVREFFLPTDEVKRWQEGAKIQTVWPDLSPTDREALISGVCSDRCWDILWAEDIGWTVD